MADPETARPAVVPATDNGSLRASHADRDHVVDALQAAAGDGRLTPEELDERLELALNAKTYAELAVLLRDLPAAGSAPGAAALAARATAAAAANRKDLVTMHYTSGHGERRGRWIVPSRMDLKVSSGHITLDFREAVITEPVVHIDAKVSSGRIVLITRPGIVVDTDNVSVRSGRVKVRAPWGEDVPMLLRIDLSGTCGSGHIVARPARRSFWQWLRRTPPRWALTA
jgi:Domain of unknown function (DUF1707)